MDNATDGKSTLALVLLAKALLDQIDEVASLKSGGHKAAISELVLAEMGKVLGELDPPMQSQFLQILVQVGSRVEMPSRQSHSEEFSELSVDAKKRFIKSIRNELLESVG